MLDINVRSNLKDVERALGELERRALPEAYRNALNDTAFELRKNIVDKTWPQAVQVKNRRFMGAALRVEKATKSKLTASIFDRLGREFLNRLTTGGTKTPQGQHIAIPTNNLPRTASGAVGRARRPRALLGKKDHFKDERGIWQRVRGGGLKILYHFERTVQVPKLFRFFESNEQFVRRRFPQIFAREFEKAVKRARFPK